MSAAGTPLAPLQVRGIGAWASGMPGWEALRAVARGEATPAADAPRRPAPELLPPNERRRAPDSVLLALEAAQSACRAAGADPATLSSIFASTHGDLGITDALCSTLARDPTEVSPIRFHNSVHNAAAGYWTIGVGCRAPSTAISAYRATFAQGLLEAALQLQAGEPAVLLVAYDSASEGPLAAVSKSSGLFGLALVLTLAAGAAPALRLTLGAQRGTEAAAGPLHAALAANAMSPALDFAVLMAQGRGSCTHEARADAWLGRELAP
jgi:hypothetical protein